MNTYGFYSSWSFGANWSEDWEEYEDGLVYEDWVAENGAWIKTSLMRVDIDPKTFSDADMLSLYNKIQAEDFRTHSCGGCI
jgi:hypothetical protein